MTSFTTAPVLDSRQATCTQQWRGSANLCHKAQRQLAATSAAADERAATAHERREVGSNLELLYTWHSRWGGARMRH